MFDINNFNVIQDENYYYVFRSLEAGDISDINTGITNVMRTDRERYKLNARYSEDSNISLNEMHDHIKIHYRKDTNCISFTTNAGIAIMYGRDKETYKDNNFNDKYVILKIPKNEMGNTSYFAPQYMIDEIKKVLDEYYEHLDELDKYQFDFISNCITQEQLDSVTKSLESEEIFEGGIEFGNTNSTNYTTLSNRQNLEKNKLIAKIDLVPFDIVPNISNKFLIKTIGSAFASMEVTHYKSIDNKYLIDCPNNIIDIFSILQQSNNPKVSEIENILIEKLSKHELDDLEKFKYSDSELTEKDLSIDNLYTLSDNGKVDYNTMRNLYIKTFYLAKSKLRVQHSINLLKQILGNSYDDVLDELNNTYGIEPEITNKQSKDKIVISDSIGLDYSTNIEKSLLNLLNGEYSKQLDYLIDNKEDCASIVMLDLLEEHEAISMEDYYVNAIIDSFDWEQFNITSIASRHRINLVNKLKESNFMSIYKELKDKYLNKDISRILLANIIKENDTLDLEAAFTIEDLEDYLGYFKVKDNKIKLTRYQADAIRNMNESYKKYQYTNVILPTGTGKSYVAITKMLEYLNSGKKVLYLAPDTEILNQIRRYLVSEVIGDSFGQDLETIVKKRYPNLILQTYSYLAKGNNKEDIINDKYDFIVADELHRTGAPEWKAQIETLYKNQDKECKILGITATPTRDCDGVDMAEYWAKFFGYTEEEIFANKHISYNMDYNQAIALGYLENPRVINCEYEFLTESEEIKKYKELVNNLEDEKEKERLLNKLRKDISNAKGIPEILRENVLPKDSCLVFCPVYDIDEETGKKLTDIQKIEKYKQKLEEIYGKDKINCYSMLGSYGKKKNEQELEKFQNSSSDKINFMIVLDKMNEGKHGKYNKLIWFRTLDDNSFVLCSQQLGRISKIRKRGLELSENERPLAIDLTNNLLRIQGTKELKKSIESDDISKFRLVVDWIKEYNKIPDINSKDQIESSMASTLKVIIYKYHNKVNNIESINGMKKKMQVKEIKRLSEELEFDIWDLRLPKRTKETRKRREVPYYLKANALYRDYMNIIEEIKLPLEKKIRIFIDMLNSDEVNEKGQSIADQILKSSNEEKFRGTTIPVGMFWNRKPNRDKIIELLFNGEYKDNEKYDKARERILEKLEIATPEEYYQKQEEKISLEEKIRIFIEMLNLDEVNEKGQSIAAQILKQGNEEKFKGTTIPVGSFWRNNKDKIIELLFNGEYKDNEKYDKARERILEKLEIATPEEYYQKQEEKISLEEKIRIFIEMLNSDEVNEKGQSIADQILKSRNEENFTNTTIPVGTFWRNNKDKIIELLFNGEYKDNEKYDKARERILEKLEIATPEEYYQKQEEKISLEEKIRIFIEMLNSDDVNEKGQSIAYQILKSRNEENFTNTTIPVGTFWNRKPNRDKIIELLFNGEYKDNKEYDKARERIKDWNFDNDIDNIKTKAFIEMLKLDEVNKKGQSIASQILKSRNEENFTNTTIPVGQFWQTNKDKIIELLFNGEYKDNKEYDKARDRILEKLEVATLEEYYDKMDEKNIIKSARINIQAFMICLRKGYILEKDASKYPTYKEYIGNKKIIK